MNVWLNAPKGCHLPKKKNDQNPDRFSTSHMIYAAFCRSNNLILLTV